MQPEIKGEAVYGALCEFLAVFANAILYARNLYPRSTFRAVRQYNTSTYENSHPEVSRWALEAAISIVDQIRSGLSSRACYVVVRDGVASERYVIDIQRLDTTIAQDPLALKEQFRAVLLQLYANTMQTAELGDNVARGSTLTVIIDGCGESLKPESPWIILSQEPKETRKAPWHANLKPLYFLNTQVVQASLYFKND